MELNETDGIRVTVELDDSIDETRQISENEFEVSFTDGNWRPLLLRNALGEIQELTENEAPREGETAVETREAKSD